MPFDPVFGELSALRPLIIWPRQPLSAGSPELKALLWPGIPEALLRLDLAGAFYYQSLEGEGLPSGMASSLKHRVLRQSGRDIKLRLAEERTINLLAASDIQATPIKGLDYARLFNAPPGERPTRDADLLITASALPAADKALLAAGYGVLSRFPFQVPLDYLHDAAYVAPELKVPVELHHHFFDRKALRHRGEDPEGGLMLTFFRMGVKNGELTGWGRWVLSAIRWYVEGCHRGLSLRDFVQVHALQEVEKHHVLDFLAGQGLKEIGNLAWELGDHLCKEGSLSSKSIELLHMTLPSIAHPLPFPGRRFLLAVRPLEDRANILRAALFPGRFQLSLAMKRDIKGAGSWAAAQLAWWFKGLKP